VLLVVKPQDMRALLGDDRAARAPGTLVVSMAAGITSALVEELLPEGTHVVRVMTNTPVFVDEAMSAISPGSHAGPEHLQVVEDLLSPVGKVVRVPESQQDAVTALSGSGPAYFFFLVEAMIDAGILLGLPRAVAAELIVQTAVGLGPDAARVRRAPGAAARGRHQPGRHHDRRHPHDGGPRRPGRDAGRHRGARDRSRELAAGG
jgi:pyrroline-5-carboxylate reductase